MCVLLLYRTTAVELVGLPEGFDIPQMPEAPQEYSLGLDKELKQKVRV